MKEGYISRRVSWRQLHPEKVTKTLRQLTIRYKKLAVDRHDLAKKAVYVNVLAYYDGKWIFFETLQTAYDVIPFEDHRNIFLDPKDLELRFPGSKDDFTRLVKALNVRTAEELWAHLLHRSLNPQRRYQEYIETMAHENQTVKRYKRRLVYTVIYRDDDPRHAELYAQLPPQACDILDGLLDALQKSGTDTIAEAELKPLLQQMKDDGVLKTRQNPWRVWQYYRATLIGRGFIRYMRATK